MEPSGSMRTCTGTGTCDNTRERRPTLSLIDKAKKFINDNPDKVRQGIDKIGDAIDQRTGGKHAEHVDKAQDAARKRFGGEGDQPQQ